MGNHITVGKMSDDEGTLGNGEGNMADGDAHADRFVADYFGSM